MCVRACVCVCVCVCVCGVYKPPHLRCKIFPLFQNSRRGRGPASVSCRLGRAGGQEGETRRGGGGGISALARLDKCKERHHCSWIIRLCLKKTTREEHISFLPQTLQ